MSLLKNPSHPGEVLKVHRRHHEGVAGEAGGLHRGVDPGRAGEVHESRARPECEPPTPRRALKVPGAATPSGHRQQQGHDGDQAEGRMAIAGKRQREKRAREER